MKLKINMRIVSLSMLLAIALFSMLPVSLAAT